MKAFQRNVSSKRNLEQAYNFQSKKYGQEYIKYRQQWDAALNLGYESDFPIYIMLEQTYKCPLRCVSCVQGYPDLRTNYDLNKAGDNGSRMSLEMYKNIVEQAVENKCRSMSMHNNDEPLLIKDVSERIAYAKEKGIMDIIFTTSGILFTEDKLEDVIEAGVTHLCFSIDALTKETYKKVREGGNYDKVMWAVERALAYREEKNSVLPIIRVSWVTNKFNEHELEDFIEFFSDKVDYVDIQPLFLGTTGTMDERKGKDIQINSQDIIPERSNKVEDYRCMSPWTTMVIRGNGDIITCPNFSGAKQVMGTIHNSTIKEVWNGPYKKLRQECKDGTYTLSGCIECADNIYVVETEKAGNTH